mgnify:CR=1 FL=1
MGKDEVTIVIFPGSLSAPKKLRLPKRLVKFSILVSFVVLIGFLGSSFYFIQQYLKLQGSEAELVKLRHESKIRKIQVEKFTQQVKNFEDGTRFVAQVIVTTASNRWMTIDQLRATLERRISILNELETDIHVLDVTLDWSSLREKTDD